MSTVRRSTCDVRREPLGVVELLLTEGTHIATCLVCGCDDLAACPGGCAWRRVDRAAGLGICSSCETPERIAAWDNYYATESVAALKLI